MLGEEVCGGATEEEDSGMREGGEAVWGQGGGDRGEE